MYYRILGWKSGKMIFFEKILFFSVSESPVEFFSRKRVTKDEESGILSKNKPIVSTWEDMTVSTEKSLFSIFWAQFEVYLPDFSGSYCNVL